ncbi:uncharacterized protein [Blastocystis hominis]|uniref:RNA helicase n=1 Tax=Blastocystis hominis TaxID=12968 RepID=D8MB15_BLAHO|nr:uncharacterized protein [Blastocystis hominis]CBK25254.2 unnamed protein product [Blastocystis hominis]|eukprot:XP_012899302.1 uncharacterized protein [Blastocystis hominis]
MKKAKEVIFDNYTRNTSMPSKRVNRKNLEAERKSLPVFAYRKDIIESVKNNPTTIIVGETGSGKTTQIAQYLLESGYFNDGVIGITQPRRVAAITVAKRVAEERGTELGYGIG